MYPGFVITAFRCKGPPAAEALDALPEDIEKCDEEEEERRSRAARMAVGDRGVLQRYQRLTKSVKDSEASTAAKEADVNKLQVRCCSVGLLCCRPADEQREGERGEHRRQGGRCEQAASVLLCCLCAPNLSSRTAAAAQVCIGVL